MRNSHSRRPDQSHEFLGALRIIFGVGLEVVKTDRPLQGEGRRESPRIPPCLALVSLLCHVGSPSNYPRRLFRNAFTWLTPSVMSSRSAHIPKKGVSRMDLGRSSGASARHVHYHPGTFGESHVLQWLKDAILVFCRKSSRPLSLILSIPLLTPCRSSIALSVILVLGAGFSEILVRMGANVQNQSVHAVCR